MIFENAELKQIAPDSNVYEGKATSVLLNKDGTQAGHIICVFNCVKESGEKFYIAPSCCEE